MRGSVREWRSAVLVGRETWTETSLFRPVILYLLSNEIFLEGYLYFTNNELVFTTLNLLERERLKN